MPEPRVDYRERLESDLRQDTARLAALLEGLSRKGMALRSLAVASDSSDGDTTLAATLLQAEHYGWGQFAFSGTTFEDLRSTGNLRLIFDDRLRAAFVNYYERWAFEQRRIDSRRSDLPALVFKLLSIEFTAGQNTVDEVLDLRQVSDADRRALVTEIGTSEFRRELQHELNYTGFVQAALERLHRDALEVLRLLEERGH